MLALLTDLRAVFDVRTGALTTLERLVIALDVKVAGLIVPEGLARLTAERHGVPVNGEIADAVTEAAVAINGRCVLPDARMLDVGPGEKIVEARTGDLVAVGLAADEVSGFCDSLMKSTTLAAAAVAVEAKVVGEVPFGSMLERPWHVKSRWMRRWRWIWTCWRMRRRRSFRPACWRSGMASTKRR